MIFYKKYVNFSTISAHAAAALSLGKNPNAVVFEEKSPVNSHNLPTIRIKEGETEVKERFDLIIGLCRCIHGDLMWEKPQENIFFFVNLLLENGQTVDEDLLKTMRFFYQGLSEQKKIEFFQKYNDLCLYTNPDSFLPDLTFSQIGFMQAEIPVHVAEADDDFIHLVAHYDLSSKLIALFFERVKKSKEAVFASYIDPRTGNDVFRQLRPKDVTMLLKFGQIPFGHNGFTIRIDELWGSRKAVEKTPAETSIESPASTDTLKKTEENIEDTENIKIQKAIRDQFWKNHDKSTPPPKQDQIVKWIQTKFKVSHNKALSADRAVRPKEYSQGGIKKRQKQTEDK